MRQAISLWIVAMIVAIALILALPVAQVSLRDSHRPEPTAVPVIPQVKFAIGKATWYDATKNNAWYTRGENETAFYAAAGPALRHIKDFRWGKKPYRIIVENLKNGRAIVAWVVDWCQCRGQTNNEKLVDLAPEAFVALGVSLERGVQRVRVTVIE